MSRFILFHLLFCCALLSLALPSIALAQQASEQPLDVEQREQALTLMKNGSQYYKLGNYKIAKKYFEESYALRPAFDVACSLAQTNAKLEAHVEAAKYYNNCLKDYPTSGDRELLRRIKAEQAEALEYVGRVNVRFPEAGMAVRLDKIQVGTTPLSDDVYVQPGIHEVEIVNPDGRRVTRAFAVKAGEKHVEHIRDFDQPAVKETPPGSPQQQEKQPQTDEGKSEPPPGPSQRKHNWVPAYVLGGVTVVTLASSIVLRVMAGQKKEKVEELDDQLPPYACEFDSSGDCAELESTSKSQRRLGIASDATMIASGVFAGATLGWVVYELARPKKAKMAAVNVQPLLDVSAHHTWFGLRGYF